MPDSVEYDFKIYVGNQLFMIYLVDFNIDIII